MKWFLIVLGLVPTLAFSEVQNDPNLSAQENFCRSRLDSAKNIMILRQTGKPLKDFLYAMDQTNKEERRQGKFDQEVADDYQSIVLAAYERPKFETTKYQLQEVNEFSQKYYLFCKKHIVIGEVP